ncbi:hypothetical protein ACF0H5_015926 [Mactra antiquata]
MSRGRRVPRRAVRQAAHAELQDRRPRRRAVQPVGVAQAPAEAPVATAEEPRDEILEGVHQRVDEAIQGNVIDFCGIVASNNELGSRDAGIQTTTELLGCGGASPNIPLNQTLNSCSMINTVAQVGFTPIRLADDDLTAHVSASLKQ